MFVLGITGGIGSGKSTVSGILREKGVLVLDADEISRTVTEPNGKAIPAIAEEFGPKVIGAGGVMNRKALMFRSLLPDLLICVIRYGS